MAFVPDAPKPSRFVPDTPIDTGPGMAPPGVGERIARGAYAPVDALLTTLEGALGGTAGAAGKLGTQALNDIVGTNLNPEHVRSAIQGALTRTPVTSAAQTALSAGAPQMAQLQQHIGALAQQYPNVAAAIQKYLPAVTDTAAVVAPGAGAVGDAAALAAARSAIPAVARSPAEVAAAAGYTGLGTKTDMLRPGPSKITESLVKQDNGVPADTVLNKDSIINARNVGPGRVYNQAEAALPDNMTHDEPLTNGIKNLQDTVSQLPRTPDVEKLQETMLDQPEMTKEQLFANIRGARQRSVANLASADPDKNALGEAYSQLAGHFEDFAGRQLEANGVQLPTWQDARTKFAQSHLAQAALHEGETVDPAVYARAAQNSPGMLTDNGAIIANVHNNLPAGKEPGSGLYGTMAAGATVGGAAGAGASHLLGVPGLEGIGATAGVMGAPAARAALENFFMRGNPEAAAAASTNPALSYFRRGNEPLAGFGRPAPELPPTQGTIPLPGGGSGPQSTLPFGPPMGDALTGTPVGTFTPGAPRIPFSGETPLPLRQQQEAASARMSPPPPPGQLPLLHPETPLPLGAPPAPPPAAASEFPIGDIFTNRAPIQGAAPTVPNVSHSVDELGHHTFSTQNGESSAIENGNYLQQKRIDVAAKAQGKGEGTAMLSKLVDTAESHGLTAASDVTMTPAAENLWTSMEKRGFTLTKNPATRNPETGNLVSTDPRIPIFTLSSNPPLGSSFASGG